jgi:hypothetical protein
MPLACARATAETNWRLDLRAIALCDRTRRSIQVQVSTGNSRPWPGRGTKVGTRKSSRVQQRSVRELARKGTTVMRSIVHSLGVALALSLPVSGIGCTADISDNVLNIDDPDVDFNTTVDVDNVEQGQSVPLTVDVEEGDLVAPEATPPPEKVDTAVYVSIHLDDTDSEPLLVTAQASVSVTIPESTPPGDHKLVCQVRKHKDGMPTGESKSISIKVKAAGTVSG